MSADPVTVSRDARDAAAAAAVVGHHGAMTDQAAGLLADVVRAVSSGSDTAAPRDALVAFFRNEVLPHALAEESTMYRAAAEDPSARLIVGAMIDEHVRIKKAIDGLTRAVDPGTVAATAGGLEALFVTHVEKENNVVVPLLAGSAAVSLADLVEGLHELVGGPDSAQDAGGGPGCGCGSECGKG